MTDDKNKLNNLIEEEKDEDIRLKENRILTVKSQTDPVNVK